MSAAVQAVQADPVPNAALLWQVLEHIKAHPETWEQRAWYCGTRACFAGHAVALGGGRVVQEYGPDEEPAYVLLEPDDPLRARLASHLYVPDQTWASVRDYAQVALGLTRPQAAKLFYMFNTYEQLEQMVMGLTGMAQAPAGAQA